MKLYPIKSIITDNGNKFSSLGEIEGLDVYFAHAYSSYDQGTNEHFNGLLREFISKGINERPRRILGYQSAKKAVWAKSNSLRKTHLIRGTPLLYLTWQLVSKKTFKKIKKIKKSVDSKERSWYTNIVVARERQRPLKTEQDEPMCRALQLKL